MGKSASVVAGATLFGSVIHLIGSNHLIWSMVALLSAFFLGWYFSGKVRTSQQNEQKYYVKTSSV